MDCARRTVLAVRAWKNRLSREYLSVYVYEKKKKKNLHTCWFISSSHVELCVSGRINTFGEQLRESYSSVMFGTAVTIRFSMYVHPRTCALRLGFSIRAPRYYLVDYTVDPICMIPWPFRQSFSAETQSYPRAGFIRVRCKINRRSRITHYRSGPQGSFDCWIQ